MKSTIPSMLRSLAGQVVPDRLFWRRKEAPFSRKGPVSETGSTRTLTGPRSIFKDIDITYVFDPDPKKGKGLLSFSEPIWTVTTEGKDARSKMGAFALFSTVAKMSAPSFSLPAGPINEGGTCAAAQLHANQMVRPSRGKDPGGMRRDADGRPFICDLCYATAHRYQFPVNSTAQVARMIWCQRLLAQDPSGRALSSEMIGAIENFAHRGHYGNLSKRLGLELGVWRNGQLVAPGYVVGRKGLMDVAIPPTKLSASDRYATSREFLAAQGAVEGEPAGFFRIHDSGDLNVGRKFAMWVSYLDAWIQVAEALPHIWFWMPTRTWIHKRMVPHLQRANQLPNLVIRASALYVDGPVPSIAGIPASGVHQHALAPGIYQCPVTPKTTSSCAQDDCRACWVSPDLIPSYTEH